MKTGEYVKALSDELRLEHHDIEWRDIIALRNIVVHNYDGLYMERIWEIITMKGWKKENDYHFFLLPKILK